MSNKPRGFTKVDRALEVRVIDWLQWTEWEEKLGEKHPAELALEMISLRKRYCIEIKAQADMLAEAIEGEIKILEAAGHKGSAFGLKVALSKIKEPRP